MMVPVGRLVVLRTTPKEQLIKAIATLTGLRWSRRLLARRWGLYYHLCELALDLFPQCAAGAGGYRSGLENDAGTIG